MQLLPIHLPDADLSIYTIPKNGGTTLWAWVYFVRTGGQLPFGNVYDETWLSDGPLMQRKLIVRRDPVDRFISGYRNFRDNRGLTLGFDEFFVQEWQAESIAQIYQCDYDAGFGDPGAWHRNLPPE
jgi:hypothetical protein